MIAMKVYNKRIPVDKFKLFHEALCANNGRYLASPRREAVGKHFSCDYEIENSDKFNLTLNRIFNKFVEIDSSQWWRRILRRYFKIKV